MPHRVPIYPIHERVTGKKGAPFRGAFLSVDQLIMIQRPLLRFFHR